MKAAAYTIERADSLDEASRRLLEGGWAVKPIAGGQSLGAMLNLRLARPEGVIDLDALPALARTTELPHAVRFGAMTTHAAIEDRRLPDPSRGLMPYVARGIAYRAVRNRGTIGGSLCHADPAADWVSAMPLLGATLIVHGPQGERRIEARDFMTSAFETRLTDGELLAAIEIPWRSEATRWGYRKFCRKTGEFAEALVGVLSEPAARADRADRSEQVDPAGPGMRVVIGALDGAPLVAEMPELPVILADARRRSEWLRAIFPGLEPARMSVVAELLRLAIDDLETPR